MYGEEDRGIFYKINQGEYHYFILPQSKALSINTNSGEIFFATTTPDKFLGELIVLLPRIDENVNNFKLVDDKVTLELNREQVLELFI